MSQEPDDTPVSRKELRSFRDVLCRVVARIDRALGEGPPQPDQLAMRRAKQALAANGIEWSER